MRQDYLTETTFPGIVSVCELPLEAGLVTNIKGIIVGATTPEAAFAHWDGDKSLIKLYLVYSDVATEDYVDTTWNLTTGKTRVYFGHQAKQPGRWDDYSHPGLEFVSESARHCCYDGAVSTPMVTPGVVLKQENEEQAKSFWPVSAERPAVALYRIGFYRNEMPESVLVVLALKFTDSA
ncbi:hypothetical protein SPFM20_00003 [Salmonella phage SPFM20]|nr:hypothetical protein SPFM8_00297 [Salmonella phage SPFM8]VFR14496.1 hypothetical protein SPFM20_00003 [Salmonella phage SPFM20]